MKLADFGLSRSLPHNHLMEEINQHRGEYLPEIRANDRSLTMGIGTPTYIGPELLKKRGEKCTYTAMADIFSLGIIFCEMFNPFSTGMERAQVLTQVSLTIPHLFEFLSRSCRRSVVGRYLPKWRLHFRTKPV